MDDKKQVLPYESKKYQVKHDKPSPPQPTEPLKPHDWVVLFFVLSIPILGLWVLTLDLPIIRFLSSIFTWIIFWVLFFLIGIWFLRNIIGSR